MLFVVLPAKVRKLHEKELREAFPEGVPAQVLLPFEALSPEHAEAISRIGRQAL